jgi:hypothetical protein
MTHKNPQESDKPCVVYSGNVPLFLTREELTQFELVDEQDISGDRALEIFKALSH